MYLIQYGPDKYARVLPQVIDKAPSPRWRNGSFLQATTEYSYIALRNSPVLEDVLHQNRANSVFIDFSPDAVRYAAVGKTSGPHIFPMDWDKPNRTLLGVGRQDFLGLWTIDRFGLSIYCGRTRLQQHFEGHFFYGIAPRDAFLGGTKQPWNPNNPNEINSFRLVLWKLPQNGKFLKVQFEGHSYKWSLAGTEVASFNSEGVLLSDFTVEVSVKSIFRSLSDHQFRM